MQQRNAFINLLYHTPIDTSKVVFASICSFFNKLCDITPEILIGLAIDTIVNQEHSILSRTGIINPYHQLYLAGFLTALFWTLESVFEYYYSISWRHIARNIQHHLRLKTYAAVQELDLVYFENATTGGLLNILQDDINQLEQFLCEGPNEIIQLLTNIIVMGLIFLYLSPMLTLIALIPIPFVMGIAYYFQHTLAHLYETVRQTASDMAGHIAYRLQGIATIKSYTTEWYELEQLEKVSRLYQIASHRAGCVNAQYIPSVRMAIMAGFITALVVGGIYALQGAIPISWYAALVFLIQRFLWPFTSLTSITAAYERSLACAKRICNILNTPRSIRSGAASLTNNSVVGKINFNRVSFTYSNGIQIFNNISFEIPARKTVAFVGATGSGKSTITKLLLRFYDPSNGSICIDDQDITTVSLKILRTAIGLVSQDTYMINGSIADNISYGTFNAPRDAIIRAAQMAQAHNFIMQLPDGYDTEVQEYGGNLSGGQRQRLSIARVIMKNAPILIFDEATSAIDNETEASLQQSMRSLRSNHTIIIIAHRLSIVHNADIIFVLDKGVITESGSHDTLLQNNGTYAHLWNAQIN